MSNSNNHIPDAVLARLKAVTKRRPKAVIEHILEHGFVTTEELTSKYGYEHAPRAARDVREEGIPLETFRVKNTHGRSIGAYRLGDLSQMKHDRIDGRIAFSKKFKALLVELQNSRCAICETKYESRYLQIDHRVPYEVAGESIIGERKIEDYMLLCSSCNRAKSWSCEHCNNFLADQKSEVCMECYWASPSGYQHIAQRAIRRLELVWDEQETSEYDELKQQSALTQETMPDFVKNILREQLKKTTER